LRKMTKWRHSLYFYFALETSPIMKLYFEGGIIYELQTIRKKGK